MADGTLALYGSGTGPRIPVRNKQARAVVKGLIEGVVKFHVERRDREPEVVELSSNGERELPEGDFVKASYAGKSLGVMCFVRT